MKLERIQYGTIKDITNSSLIKLKFNEFLTIWYSYSTPIAVEHHNYSYLTNESYSRTTGMHMKEIMRQWGDRPVEQRSHMQMKELVDRLTKETGAQGARYYDPLHLPHSLPARA